MDTLLSECIEWTGTTFKKTGYGRRWFQGKDTTAHKAAFIEHHGREPVGLVRHACDNRLCYNVEHLVEGSQQDNMDDMVERGRSNRGQKHWASKLTPGQVEEIREAYASGEGQPAIAKRYNISRGHVSNIVRKSTWKITEKKTESIGR